MLFWMNIFSELIDSIFSEFISPRLSAFKLGVMFKNRRKKEPNNIEPIDEDELPVPVRKSFADLKHLMHRVSPMNGEGPICASVRKMSVDEANKCAQIMVDIYGDMIRHHDSGQTALPLQIDDRSAVPPFLIKSN